MSIILNAAGGLALFLLAMVMMTNGLKTFIGRDLRTFLQKWTSSPVRGVLSGALVTAVVQSSSAVTVATIGFVNAGVLTIQQAIGVIFGSNVGTTMTGWLVSLIGFGLKIDTFAMPMLALGVGIRFMVSSKKLQALGEALTGFGLFFLGLSILKDSFSGVAATYGTSLLTSADAGSAITFVLAGILATVLTQSSSAAIAIILMAASESVIGINAAAAAIIGTNIGTTSTALFATIKATPNAKRVAVGHVAFNLITGAVALAMFPGILALTNYAGHVIGVEGNIVPFLALFHTVFNLLGVFILFPFIGRISKRLEQLFRSEEDDLSRPRYLDQTVISTPALAVSALQKELARMNEYAGAIVLSATGGTHVANRTLQRKSEAIYALGQAMTEFITGLRMEAMSREVSEEIPQVIRTIRYLDEAVKIAPEVNSLTADIKNIKKLPSHEQLETLIDQAKTAITLFSETEEQEDHYDKSVIIMDKFQTSYQDAKSGLLRDAAAGKLPPEDADTYLDKISHMRRMIEQMAKADKMLRQHHDETAMVA